MQPIINSSKLPKFLRVTHWQVIQSHNKYLPEPWREGEIVKVQPAENQRCDHTYDSMTPRVEPCTDEFWRERYCKIWRRDIDGKFTRSCSLEWQALDYLKKKI